MIKKAIWIRNLRNHLGDNQEKFAGRIPVSQATSSRWETGSEPKTDHWDALKALAMEHGYPLMNSSAAAMVFLIGFVGASTEINLFGNGEGPFDEVEMPHGGGPDTVAVEIRGDSMNPQMQDRWLLYYNNRHEPPHEGLHGKICIVCLPDNRILVKTLVPGSIPGHFHLQSSNAALILDQEVVWAAKIEWIKPR